MSNTAMESPNIPVERASESSNQGTVEAVRTSYSKDAPTDLQSSATNTADQHLNLATFTGDSIQFAPSDSGAQRQAQNDDGSSYRFDADGTRHYSHKDASGRLTEESMTRPDGSGVARQYGNDGSRKDITWDKDGNRNSQSFDKDGRLTDAETRDSNGAVSKYRYDADGTKHYSHKAADGRLTEESMTRPDGSGVARQYGVDGSRKEISWDKDNKIRTLAYDKDNRRVRGGRI